MAYRLRRAAINDLDAIWNHSVETWNIDVAETYIADIKQCFDHLGDRTKPSRPGDDLFHGCQKAFVNKHVVYYEDNGEGVEVVRILHQRMDVHSQHYDTHT